MTKLSLNFFKSLKKCEGVLKVLMNRGDKKETNVLTITECTKEILLMK
jgi:hypothetical protein